MAGNKNRTCEHGRTKMSRITVWNKDSDKPLKEIGIQEYKTPKLRKRFANILEKSAKIRAARDQRRRRLAAKKDIFDRAKAKTKRVSIVLGGLPSLGKRK
jgi:hypothetical protein